MTKRKSLWETAIALVELAEHVVRMWIEGGLCWCNRLLGRKECKYDRW